MSRAGAAWKFGPKSNVASRNLGKRSESAGRLSIAQSIIWPRFGSISVHNRIWCSDRCDHGSHVGWKIALFLVIMFLSES
jgi:hypothetical protein